MLKADFNLDLDLDFYKTGDWNRLTFGDLIDPRTAHLSYIGPPLMTSISYLDMNTGVAYYNQSYFISYGLFSYKSPQ